MLMTLADRGRLKIINHVKPAQRLENDRHARFNNGHITPLPGQLVHDRVLFARNASYSRPHNQVRAPPTAPSRCAWVRARL